MFIVYDKQNRIRAAYNNWYRAFTKAYELHGYYEWWRL